MIEDVLKPSGTENGAGLKRTIYFGLADQVETWPTLPSSPSNYEDLVTHDAAVAMQIGEQMYSFYATIRKSSLETLSAGSRGSLTAINRLKIVRAEISAAVVGFIKQHKNDEMIFIVEDLNGKPRFLGTEDLPAMFEEFNIPTGGDVTDEHDVSITIESVGPEATFYGTAASPLAIPLTPAV